LQGRCERKKRERKKKGWGIWGGSVLRHRKLPGAKPFCWGRKNNAAARKTPHGGKEER